MVSKAGELEGFVGKIMRAGATSIQELAFLILFAIDDIWNMKLTLICN